MTSTRSLPVPSADADHRKPKRFGLSWVQIIAAGFASITATVILSFFSISGTLIGAAVFSMASAVGNAVYGQSLRTTRDHVKDVVPFGKTDPSSPTIAIEIIEDGEQDGADDHADESEPLLPSAPAGALSRLAWKRVALLAAIVFAFVIAVVTAVELVAGRPLTDVVRGDHEGSGTSLFGGTTGSQVQVPTRTVTVTPSVTFTTPTVTQTAPAVTRTATPTETTTQTPTGSTSPSSTSIPSASTSAGGTDTSAPASGTTPTSTRHAGR